MSLRKVFFGVPATLVLLSLAGGPAEAQSPFARHRLVPGGASLTPPRNPYAGRSAPATTPSQFPKPQLVQGGAALTPPRHPYAGPAPAPQLRLSPNSPLAQPRGLPPHLQPSPPTRDRSIFDRLPRLPVEPTIDRTPRGTRVFGGRFGAPRPEPNPYLPIPPELR
jgi:hypothetical protein